MVKFKIYDFDNIAKEVKLPIKDISEISSIDVKVITGDEVVDINLANGDCVTEDALVEGTRLYDFIDNVYTVEGERVKEWIEFFDTADRPNKFSETKSYTRAEYFE
jgi:hypothetical protein